MNPSEWQKAANIAALAEPKEGVTLWYSGKASPKRIGAYERLFTDGKYYNHWDGTVWRVRPNGYIYPQNVQVGSYVAWRGLTEEAYKERIAFLNAINESSFNFS